MEKRKEQFSKLDHVAVATLMLSFAFFAAVMALCVAILTLIFYVVGKMPLLAALGCAALGIALISFAFTRGRP